MSEYEQMIFHQRIRLPYRYTAGPAQRAVLEGLADGVLRGSRCDHCGIVLAPSRPFCPRCSLATGATVDLAETGTVEGWTTRTRDGNTVTLGMVRLDGADTALLHVVDVPEAELAIGTRVHARWKDTREGEITDVEAFEADG